jgi:hypothetical protein
MLGYPSDAASKRESIRLTKVVTWVLWRPVALLLQVGGVVKRVFVTPKSVAEQRVLEKDRQAGIRRKLRGLPAHHDAGKPTA